MSDTQDDLTALIAELKDAQASDVTLDLTIGNNGTLQRAIEALERAHFQRHAEPVACMWPTNLEGISAFAFTELAIEEGMKQPGARLLYTSPPIPASQWLPIETAPKDGTLVLLLLAHDNDFDNGIEAEAEHQPRTIGHNNFEHDGIDRWQFAGWNWEQDCYTEGWGTPIAWMPLPAAPAPKEGA